MVILQYFDGVEWIECSRFINEWVAWGSLGEDNLNYRTIDTNGNVLTDKCNSEDN